jgi:hypothetical protein
MCALVKYPNASGTKRHHEIAYKNQLTASAEYAVRIRKK